MTLYTCCEVIPLLFFPPSLVASLCLLRLPISVLSLCTAPDISLLQLSNAGAGALGVAETGAVGGVEAGAVDGVGAVGRVGAVGGRVGAVGGRVGWSQTIAVIVEDHIHRVDMALCLQGTAGGVCMIISHSHLQYI